jgi:hypothetical protein
MSLQELTFVLTFTAPNTELRYSLPGLQVEQNRGAPISRCFRRWCLVVWLPTYQGKGPVSGPHADQHGLAGFSGRKAGQGDAETGRGREDGEEADGARAPQTVLAEYVSHGDGRVF